MSGEAQARAPAGDHVRPARGGRVLPLLAAGAAFLILVGLGTWQLERRSWKLELIRQVEERADAPARPLPPPAAWGRLSRAEDEYAHVQVTGSFDHARETLVYTVLSDPKGEARGQGFLVITPLMLPDGRSVLVNRGFVPLEKRTPASRAQGQVAGPVSVTGLLRFPEEASVFVPANDPAKDAWYRRDPAEIAAARGLPGAAPFLIDADAAPNPGGLPQGGETRLAFPNRHLEYALTWYGLAATLLGVGLAVALSQRAARRRTPHP
ncbi:SURF1 family protein [Azorhizobium doebereinerae]|uniref:SURF1 family protein n=1 Tax=Azorhizobium doebereinerae TaxID=281091 RepID=UPI00042220AB|nr:SURF1 family protein [Azorhizobium doebereinerae]